MTFAGLLSKREINLNLVSQKMESLINTPYIEYEIPQGKDKPEVNQFFHRL